MRKFIVVLGMALFLCACAAQRPEIDQSQLAQLKPGVTTKQEVLAKFGEPTTALVQSDGTSSIAYMFSSSNTEPILGLFSYRGKAHNSSVIFMFDANGRLKTYTGSQSNNQMIMRGGSISTGPTTSGGL